jgi:hypothetical protein
LFSNFEERRDVLVTSDIPIPIERHVINGEDRHRFVFGYFDLRGKHDLKSGIGVDNLSFDNLWSMGGPNVVGRQIMDSPMNTGFTTLVLPSTIPSFNIRVMLRRKRWNYETSTYEHNVEVPLLKNPSDTLILRLLFSSQV